ncbi:MAG TPA: hypothetical protein VFC61_01090 [Blastocatellia bacterium]|nr:hypothetical protein [Blastocatellia bacterium]
MGDLVRFPGAKVDHEFLDAFEWTVELRAEYAAKARALAARYGSNAPTADLPHEGEGICDDCGRVVARRWRFGTAGLVLCERDVAARTRVAREAAEPLLPPPVRGECVQVAPIFASYEKQVAWQRWRQENPTADATFGPGYPHGSRRQKGAP